MSSHKAASAQVRDVPASCICWWEYVPQTGSWSRIKAIPGCPWHEDAA